MRRFFLVAHYFNQKIPKNVTPPLFRDRIFDLDAYFNKACIKSYFIPYRCCYINALSDPLQSLSISSSLRLKQSLASS